MKNVNLARMRLRIAALGTLVGGLIGVYYATVKVAGHSWMAALFFVPLLGFLGALFLGWALPAFLVLALHMLLLLTRGRGLHIVEISVEGELDELTLFFIHGVLLGVIIAIFAVFIVFPTAEIEPSLLFFAAIAGGIAGFILPVLVGLILLLLKTLITGRTDWMD